MAAPIVGWYRRVTQRKFIRYGMPFMVLVIGSAVGLKQFTSLRYIFRKRKILSPEEAEALGVEFKKKDGKSLSLDELYEEMQETADLNNWRNIRGPRPGEDSQEMQDEQRRQFALEEATTTTESRVFS